MANVNHVINGCEVIAGVSVNGEVKPKRVMIINCSNIVLGKQQSEPTRIENGDGTFTITYEIDAHKIFNQSKQVFGNIFLIDIENGSRGYYPGKIN